MEDLIHVIYLGAASSDLSEHDTVKFLNEARKANRQNDVSGMMLYVGGCLLLLLEGEAAKVDAAARIPGMDHGVRNGRGARGRPVAWRTAPVRSLVARRAHGSQQCEDPVVDHRAAPLAIGSERDVSSHPSLDQVIGNFLMPPRVSLSRR